MLFEAVEMKENSSALSVRRGLLYVGFAAIAWGTGGAVAAILYQHSGLGPIAVSFWRFFIGMLILAGVGFILSSKSKRSSMRTFLRDRWDWIIVIGFGLAVYQTAYFAAVQQSGLAVATVVTLGWGPILIAVGSHFMMGERIGRSGGFIIILAILGLGLLTGSGGFRLGSLQGLALAFLSAVCYACVTLMTRAIGRRGNVDQFNVTFFGTIVGTVFLLPFALFEGMIPLSESLFNSLCLLGYLGVIPTAVAYLLFNIGLSAIRATTASVIVLVEPVTAAIIAVLFLDEQLTILAVFGMIVLMSSVLILAFAEQKS